jgi:hypothetical protein
MQRTVLHPLNYEEMGFCQSLFSQGSLHKQDRFAIARESLLQLRKRLMRGVTEENFINGAPLATVCSLAAELTLPLSIQLDIKTPGKTIMPPTLPLHPKIIPIHLD